MERYCSNKKCNIKCKVTAITKAVNKLTGIIRKGFGDFLKEITTCKEKNDNRNLLAKKYGLTEVCYLVNLTAF